MILSILFLLVGLAILIAGGESLVRGASSLARRMGVAPIVIGLTIVAFGTSAPELIVNIFSAIKGTTDIAIGNIVGSNIANIFLILGISSLITPLIVKKGTVWKEIPFALLGAVLLFIMASDELFDKIPLSALTRTDGLALIAVFIIFLYYIFGISKVEGGDKEEVKKYSFGASLLMTFGGIAALFFGGKLLVDNAIILARLAGLSEILIGSTIVAVGTSLPELVTSVIAAKHKESDIAIGNIVGSNIFNIFWILGLTATILPLPVAPALMTDIVVSIIATLFLFGFMFVWKRHQLGKAEGVIFLLLYAGYLGFLLNRG